ncbi:MAG: tRNA preQ1(34) S-adenosylmethionine ribosyltransferase-isomerase QueA [Candidatus Brocadiia bacterium]
MRTADFDYELPRELIAQHPLPRRDESRLLVLDRAADRIEHRRFPHIAEYLGAGDLLVLNDTQVIPARLVGRRPTGGRVEALLVAPEGDAWRAMVHCRGRLRPGEPLAFEGGALACTYRGRRPGGEAELVFDRPPAELLEALRRVGRAPLPPYIKRPPEEDPHREADRRRYQTVYAARPGAIAAPTAGLHFTPRVLDALEVRGVRRVTITLHVGRGTFQPVRAERVEDHEMHAEWFDLPQDTAQAVTETRQAGGRVVAVGTTVTRVLETVARRPQWGPARGTTELFIAPGFTFRVTDALVTNFHLPRSTLLMLVAAFAGAERVLAAYEEAKRRSYRFYSYGDAMLIL